MDAPDPAAVQAGLEIGRRHAVPDALMTATILPLTRPGDRFDPATIQIEPKNQHT